MGVIGQNKQHKGHIDDHHDVPSNAYHRQLVYRGGTHKAEQPQGGNGQSMGM